jgi:hypothetical protein
MNIPDHPVWALARLVVLMITLVLILYINDNQFDDDEFRIIQWFLVAASGTVGLEFLIRKILGVKNGK